MGWRHWLHPLDVVMVDGVLSIHRMLFWWMCKATATRPDPPYGLFIAPLRVAFFQEGVDPFAGVVGVEQIDKALALFT